MSVFVILTFTLYLQLEERNIIILSGMLAISKQSSVVMHMYVHTYV